MGVTDVLCSPPLLRDYDCPVFAPLLGPVPIHLSPGLRLSGPCSYSLITDWFPPESRTLAYSIYAFGAQFGGPVSTLNTELIAWLGWRAAFQFLALAGFVILGISILCFDEPERGRFDINHSVMNNPEDSIAQNSIAY